MKRRYPLVPEIHQALHQQFRELQQNYSKILPIRLDLYYSCNTDLHGRRNDDYSTQDIKVFIEGITQLQGVIGTAWVMEHGEERGVHFHVIIYVNGQYHHSNVNFVNESLMLWERITDQDGWCHVPNADNAHYPVNALKMISHADTEAMKDWFYAMDYLAKQKSKFQMGYVYEDFFVSSVRVKSTRGRPRIHATTPVLTVPF